MTAMDICAQLHQLQASLTYGGATWRHVEAVGLQALAAGSTEPELISLADVSPVTDDLLTLVVRVADSLSCGSIDQDSAAVLHAHQLANDMLSGKLKAADGALKLWQLARRAPNLEGRLISFIGLASELQDNPDDERYYEEQIRAAAAALVRSL